jgi:large subunit ribosomal protein L25
MAEAVTLAVEPRDTTKNKGVGTRVARRLRRAGRIPAILYGHKQDTVPLSLARDDVWGLIKSGHHLVQLRLGEQTEMALVRDVQWDYLGKEIIHLDFFRVSAHERIETTVPIVLHGTPAGLSEGGTLEQPVHNLVVSCEATSIPDSIRVEVAGLRVGDMVHVRDLTLPAGVTTTADADVVIAHVVAKYAVAEPTPVAAEGTPAQPEVIGRKEKEEEDKDKAK